MGESGSQFSWWLVSPASPPPQRFRWSFGKAGNAGGWSICTSRGTAAWSPSNVPPAVCMQQPARLPVAKTPSPSPPAPSLLLARQPSQVGEKGEMHMQPHGPFPNPSDRQIALPLGTSGHISYEEKQPANLITLARGEEKQRPLKWGGFLPIKHQAPGVSPDRVAHQSRLKVKVNGLLVRAGFAEGRALLSPQPRALLREF